MTRAVRRDWKRIWVCISLAILREKTWCRNKHLLVIVASSHMFTTCFLRQLSCLRARRFRQCTLEDRRRLMSRHTRKYRLSSLITFLFYSFQRRLTERNLSMVVLLFKLISYRSTAFSLALFLTYLYYFFNPSCCSSISHGLKLF